MLVWSQPPGHLTIYPELILISALGLKTSKQVNMSVFLQSLQKILACGKPLKSARKVHLTDSFSWRLKLILSLYSQKEQTSSTFLTQGEATTDFGVIQVYQVLKAFVHL